MEILKMRLLYSNMLPMKLEDDQESFIDYFQEAIQKADEIEIAVGYVSKAALKELEALVDKFEIKRICLTVGMYYHEGMPEGTYNVAMALNENWVKKEIGEVRLVRTFKYHGKYISFIRREFRLLELLAHIIWEQLNWRLQIGGSMSYQRLQKMLMN